MLRVMFSEDFVCFIHSNYIKKSRITYNNIVAEVVEHCCSVTSLQLGETMQNIAKDMDTHSYKVPLGVTAGRFMIVQKKFLIIIILQ